MATISKSFTAVGSGEAINVKAGGWFSYSVSGTFVGTVRVVSSSNGGASWELVDSLTATGTASGFFEVKMRDAASYLIRYECTAYTSGTIVTSLTDLELYYPESTVTTATNVSAATTVWQDMTSIVVLPGVNVVSLLANITANGATAGSYSEIAISQYSGTTTTDHVKGVNAINSITFSSARDAALDIPSYRISVSAPTTLYGKLTVQFSAGTPQYTCRMSAINLTALFSGVGK